MRILMLNYEYPPLGGGAGNATEQLARAIAARGHAVMVVTSGFAGLDALEHAEGVTIHRLPVRRWAMDRSSVWEMLSFIRAARRSAPALVEAFAPDVNVTFFAIPGGPVALRLKRQLGLPYVLMLRGGDVPGTEPGAFMKIAYALTTPVSRRVWRGAARLVANSAGLKQTAGRFDPQAAIDVVPNGVDCGKFRPAEAAGVSGRPVVVAVGRMTRQKGFDTLLTALSRIPGARRPLLRIVGDGPLRGALERQRDELGLGGDVEFLGWLDRDGVAEAVRRAQIYVLSSRYEGMSNTLLEAMASGLGVVATDVEGTRDVIADGDNGLIVPVADSAALAGAISKLVAEGDLRAELAAKARDTVAERFSWDGAAAKLLEIAAAAAARH